MGKDKLRKFRENLTFDCFIQPEFDEVFPIFPQYCYAKA